MQALPLVRHGDSGENVRTVQGGLNARHYSVAIDGVFGPVTSEAVKHLQAARHLSADGVVGPKTWAALMGVA